MRFFSLLIGLGWILSAGAAIDYDRAQIEERIKPVGEVTVEEESTQVKPAEPAEAQVENKEKEVPGQKIYQQYCAVCHQGGLAGAPKFQDTADWKPRLASKTLDELTASAIKGLNAMPAKGTCMTCSDADMKAAIEYMLPKS